MVKKVRKTLKNNDGFTILELIVVIAIMGFLIALVAPKLAGVADTSKKPTCDTNQQRLSDAVERNITEKGNIPSGLTNLIPDTDNAKMEAGARVVATNEKTTSDGGTTMVDKNKWIYNGVSKDKVVPFAAEFAKKNHLFVHKLNAGEIRNIKELGITELIDYETGARKPIDQIHYVLMIGSGAKGNEESDKISPFKSTTEAITNPELMYRIVLGVGAYSDLAEEGIVESMGKCPTSIQNKDIIGYSNYSIVLPRLEETVKRLDSNVKMTFQNSNNTATKILEAVTKQEPSFFSVLCPEGDLWPEPKVKSWIKR